MEISTLQVILVFLVSCICGAGSILDEFQTHRPLIACTLIGLVLGDVKTGVIVGGQDIATGIAVAIPLAAAGQVLTYVVRAITVGFQHAADKSVLDGNLNRLDWIHFGALMLQAMRIAIPALIVALTAGTDVVQTMLNAIPEVVTTGLKIAGGFIAVVGYAMVINMMRAGHLMPFFYAGFVIAAFTDFNLVALGVLGTIMAVLYIQIHPKYNKSQQVVVAANQDNDLDNRLD